MSSDPPCKNGNVRFSLVHLKFLSNKVYLNNNLFVSFNWFSIADFQLKLRISCLKEAREKINLTIFFSRGNEDILHIFD